MFQMRWINGQLLYPGESGQTDDLPTSKAVKCL